MGITTGVRWADATWPTHYGCRKKSAGCRFCYAERDMRWTAFDFRKVTRSADASFYAPLKWAKSGKLKPGSHIFPCPWSDWFIEEADAWRDDAWQVIRETPQFLYLILTKRAHRMENNLPDDWGNGWPNVALGVSAERQEEADERIPYLLNVPARYRFVSIEPMLGPVDLRYIKSEGSFYRQALSEELIDQVITGGESGPKDKIRRAELDWFRDVRDQCEEFGVRYFHKQHGGNTKIDGEWGGHLLDGVDHSEVLPFEPPIMEGAR